jgi:hypothetical protein
LDGAILTESLRNPNERKHMPATLTTVHPAVAGLGITGATEAHAAQKADRAKAAKAAKPKPKTTVEKALKTKQTRDAKKLIDSVKKLPASRRPHGHIPVPGDMESLRPRDRAKYTDKVLAIACGKCSARPKCPCISDTGPEGKAEVRSPHKPRISAAA